MWDQHMHCMFSGDSDADPVLMIKSAINKGLDGICFTDHLDYDYKEEPGLFDLDIAAYEKRIKRLAIVLKEKGCPINIHWGIEIGLQPHITDKNNEVTKKYPFDLVIGSSHVVNGIDPYYPAFYKGKTEHEAYTEYFESILDNLHSGADFDVYGHIDYVVRYGPDKNKYYSYERYADIIDAILKEIISQGKGIELNTAGFKYGLGHPNPTEDVLKRYHELGGEIIKLDSSPNSTHVNVFEMAGIDPKKVEEVLKNQIILIIIYLTRKSARWSKPIRPGEHIT